MSLAKILRPTLFAGPLLLYLASTGVGLWVAPGEREAWVRLAMTVVSLALYGLLVRVPAQVSAGRWGKAAPLGVFFGLLPTAISLYFLLIRDGGSWWGKLPWLEGLDGWLSAVAVKSRYALDPNTAGGLIAVFLPLQFCALKPFRHYRGFRWARILAAFISLLGLLLSASRGAWIAFGAMLLGWGLWRFLGRLPGLQGSRWRRVGLWLLAVAVAAGCGLAFLFSPWGNSARAVIEGDRAPIWRNSLDLALDYPFTGLGPGRFGMAYSSYSLLIHVEHTFHAHNLFLDVWLEQGLLGLVALGWLAALAIWPQPAPSAWRGAALASLAVILLHGLVDDVFWGYGGRMAVLALPLALLARSESDPASSPASPRAGRVADYSALAVVAGLALTVLGIISLPRMRASFLANLGAVAQSQVELSVYRWPEWPAQDEVRRSLSPDLLPARLYYQAALTFDPENATANRRLGQIELSLGEYETACDYVRQAYASAPGQRATRQLMGECYAIVGDLVDAAALWRTIDISQEQITLRWFWYDYLGDRQRSDWIGQAAALVQSP